MAAKVAADAPLLRDGDTIPIEMTAEAATVENLLTGAAVLVNGGAVQNLTDIINGAGKAAGSILAVMTTRISRRPGPPDPSASLVERRNPLIATVSAVSATSWIWATAPATSPATCACTTWVPVGTWSEKSKVIWPSRAWISGLSKKPGSASRPKRMS